jgi:aspartyl protease family protein
MFPLVWFAALMAMGDPSPVADGPALVHVEATRPTLKINAAIGATGAAPAPTASFRISPPPAARAQGASTPDIGLVQGGHDIWRAADGLFYIDAVINGAQVRLLVDTGASMIVLTQEDARRVGAAPADTAYTIAADTAGGGSRMAPITLAQMRVGQTDASAVPAVVASGGLGVSLLGQNWLSHIGSLTIEGDRMILR